MALGYGSLQVWLGERPQAEKQQGEPIHSCGSPHKSGVASSLQCEQPVRERSGAPSLHFFGLMSRNPGIRTPSAVPTAGALRCLGIGWR